MRANMGVREEQLGALVSSCLRAVAHTLHLFPLSSHQPDSLLRPLFSPVPAHSGLLPSTTIEWQGTQFYQWGHL